MKLVACQLTPSHRINVWRLAVHPLVILIVPAIKMDAKETLDYTLHRGHTDEPGFHQVHCLHLHACLEAMVWTVLGAEKMKTRIKKSQGHCTQSKPILTNAALTQAGLQPKASRQTTSPQIQGQLCP